MKQIASFNIARLRVEEDFGFLKLVETETGNLPSSPSKWMPPVTTPSGQRTTTSKP